jgi:AbrB family looped-hinge helix DNA binding protein
METATLLSRGRVVLPLSVRERLNWGPGTELAVEDTAAGVLLRPVTPLTVNKDENLGATTKRKPKTRHVRS